MTIKRFPDGTEKPFLTPSALHGSDAVDRVARALYTETREEIGYSTWNGALSFEKAKFHRLAQAAIAAMRPASGVDAGLASELAMLAEKASKTYADHSDWMDDAEGYLAADKELTAKLRANLPTILASLRQLGEPYDADIIAYRPENRHD